jgi:hypothetical protein
MLATYPAVLRDNRIEWSGAVPQSLPGGNGVRVLITFLEEVSDNRPPPQGERMAAALERLAVSQGLMYIVDAVAWERETRQERPLPTRRA